MSLFSVDSKDVGLLAFVKRNALKRLLSETYPKTARKRDFAHPGLEPRHFIVAFSLQREQKRKTDRHPTSGGGLCGWEEAKDIQENADNAKNTLLYLRFGRREKTTIVSCVAFCFACRKTFCRRVHHQYLSFSKKR